MKIQSYKNMSVEMIRSTDYPAELVALAMSLTQKSDPTATIPVLTIKTCQFLWNAEHVSLFEHVGYTFLVQGVSRSFLAQITRQRTASPTSGSQHYQDYTSYPCAIDFNAPNTNNDLEAMADVLQHSVEVYDRLIDHGMAREEARQVLPNASCVNYLWTIDALNLFKFLRQRLCNRNVLEMRIFAYRVLSLVTAHFPEWFNICGPQCYMGDCKQGYMRCKEEIWIPAA